MKKTFTGLFTLFIALPLLVTASIPQVWPKTNPSSHVNTTDHQNVHTTLFGDAGSSPSQSSSQSSSSSSNVDPNFNFYRFSIFLTSFPGSGNDDPTLISPSGFILTPENHLVVANSGNNTSTTYTPSLGGLNFNPGTISPTRPTLFINVIDAPVDVVMNHSKHSFLLNVTSHKKKEPAEFIYCNSAGKLLAYNRYMDPLNAIVVVDNSTTGASYTGITIAKVNDRDFLYVTDVVNAKVDMFNSEFEFVKSFTDPETPAGFVPFNVEVFNDRLYVVYASFAGGPGSGFVDIFTLKGKFIKRLISDVHLNVPYGLALAPKKFGPFSNALMVANTADGLFNAFDAQNGEFLGSLFSQSGQQWQVFGLFDINFDHRNPDRPFLYFSSGFNQFNSAMGTFEYAGNDQ